MLKIKTDFLFFNLLIEIGKNITILIIVYLLGNQNTTIDCDFCENHFNSVSFTGMSNLTWTIG